MWKGDIGRGRGEDVGDVVEEVRGGVKPAEGI